jgi:hypothetical protein
MVRWPANCLAPPFDRSPPHHLAGTRHGRSRNRQLVKKTALLTIERRRSFHTFHRLWLLIIFPSGIPVAFKPPDELTKRLGLRAAAYRMTSDHCCESVRRPSGLRLQQMVAHPLDPAETTGKAMLDTPDMGAPISRTHPDFTSAHMSRFTLSGGSARLSLSPPGFYAPRRHHGQPQERSFCSMTAIVRGA